MLVVFVCCGRNSSVISIESIIEGTISGRLGGSLCVIGVDLQLGECVVMLCLSVCPRH